jgi:hypothetical protein
MKVGYSDQRGMKQYLLSGQSPRGDPQPARAVLPGVPDDAPTALERCLPTDRLTAAGCSLTGMSVDRKIPMTLAASRSAAA